MAWQIFIAFIFFVLLVASGVSACNNGTSSAKKERVNEYFTIEKKIMPDGSIIEKGTIGGPPEPPLPEEYDSEEPDKEPGHSDSDREGN